MLKCASFFSGVGGIDLAFENAGFKIVYSNEIDPYAIQTYEKNFNIKVDNRSICDIKCDELEDFDVMLAGFPCQAFSIAGKREGFNDSKGRGNLFFELVRIMKAKKPKIVFFENVKNLVMHDNGNTFKIILKELENLGYFVKWQVLNACEYGNVRQNRERVYIVGFLDKNDYDTFSFPKKIQLTSKLSDFIDFNKKLDDKYYYTKERFSYIYDKLMESCDDVDTSYQWRRTYVRKNMNGLVATITAAGGMGGHNVSIVKTKHGFRKITPRECFNLQGFPRYFKLGDLSDSRLYKQAGNSVCVSVVERIAKNIIENN